MIVIIGSCVCSFSISISIIGIVIVDTRSSSIGMVVFGWQIGPPFGHHLSVDPGQIGKGWQGGKLLELFFEGAPIHHVGSKKASRVVAQITVFAVPSTPGVGQSCSVANATQRGREEFLGGRRQDLRRNFFPRR